MENTIKERIWDSYKIWVQFPLQLQVIWLFLSENQG